MKLTHLTHSVLAIVAVLLPLSNAFWRMDCHSPVGLARIDPLVSPGGPSDHAHTIHGSSAFGADTNDTDALTAGNCTSCLVTQDKSAYWTPALYFQSSSGQFTVVPQVGGMLAYYLLYSNPGDTSVKAFPKDFSMIAGDTRQRNFTMPVPDPPQSLWYEYPDQTTQAGLRQKALGFNCLNYAAPPEGTLYRHFMPDKEYLDANCPQGVRAELAFPSCWNGKDVTSPDHKSHMAYPDLVLTGTCPDDYPVRLVTLLFETIWDTAAFKDQEGSFVWANGDPTGYGYHGDFIMGWDEAFLQSAVDTCTNPSGQITDCPLFDIQTQAEGATCKIDPATLLPAIRTEDVTGPRDGLPGNVQIFPGPGYAVGKAPAVPTTASVPVLSHSAGSTIVGTESVLGGGVFAESTLSIYPTQVAVHVAVLAETTTSTSTAPSSTTTSTSTSLSTTTPLLLPLAPSTTAPPIYQEPMVFTTIWKTNGNEVIEMVVVEEVVTVTEDETQTVTIEVPARKRRAAHIHRHGHGHAHGMR